MKIIKYKNFHIRTRDSISKTSPSIWFFHGLGDYGSFDNAFNAESIRNYNLFEIDFPGFGMSKHKKEYADLEELSQDICDAIMMLSPNKEINIVAHSSGGILGNIVCRDLSSSTYCPLTYVNVEGLLVEDGSRSSSKSVNFKSTVEFKNYMVEGLSKSQLVELQDYSKKLEKADANALFFWASEAYKWSMENKSGLLYSSLSLPKVYFSGNKSFLKLDHEYVQAEEHEMVVMDGSSHWPMIDNEEVFYEKLNEALCNPDLEIDNEDQCCLIL